MPGNRSGAYLQKWIIRHVSQIQITAGSKPSSTYGDCGTPGWCDHVLPRRLPRGPVEGDQPRVAVEDRFREPVPVQRTVRPSEGHGDER